MKANWIIEPEDIVRIKQFVKKHRNDPNPKLRYERNIKQPPPKFTKSEFWFHMITCQTTTQQRSGPGSLVDMLKMKRPYPLSYYRCKSKSKLADYVENILSIHKLRRSSMIAQNVAYNLNWLENEKGWKIVKDQVSKLIECRSRNAFKKDKFIERATANLIDTKLKGFGPKQSRNLLQALGLTRFEIPIDSRLMKWFNEFGFPMHLSSDNLSDNSYYEFVLDGVQELCTASKVYPCILDACIFSSFDDVKER